jgi:hypothetical protein
MQIVVCLVVSLAYVSCSTVAGAPPSLARLGLEIEMLISFYFLIIFLDFLTFL